MWNTRISPASFNALGPRARVMASLSGFGLGRLGVETQGRGGIHNMLLRGCDSSQVAGLAGLGRDLAPLPTLDPATVASLPSSTTVSTAPTLVTTAALAPTATATVAPSLLTAPSLAPAPIETYAAPSLAPAASYLQTVAPLEPAAQSQYAPQLVPQPQAQYATGVPGPPPQELLDTGPSTPENWYCSDSAHGGTAEGGRPVAAARGAAAMVAPQNTLMAFWEGIPLWVKIAAAVGAAGVILHKTSKGA